MEQRYTSGIEISDRVNQLHHVERMGNDRSPQTSVLLQANWKITPGTPRKDNLILLSGIGNIIVQSLE